MFKTNLFGTAALLVSLTTLGVWLTSTAGSQEPVQKERQQWEAMALSTKTTAIETDLNVSQQINRAGREGWELVDVEVFPEGEKSGRTVYYFRRPR